jgi:hypothetical protein
MSRTRISSKPDRFVAQMKILDKLQTSEGTPPNDKKYQDWSWTDEESAEVTRVKEKACELHTIMSNTRSCPPEIKDEMKLLIKQFLEYDHGKIEPHNLLNKIAMFGKMPDWESTNVKRGTPLAKKPVKRKGGVLTETVKPTLKVRRIGVAEHLLEVFYADAPESKSPPPGYTRINMFCYVGTEPPANHHQYEYVGRAKRGLFRNSFTGMQPIEDTRIYAWYIARYENGRGVQSSASEVLRMEIFLQTA